LDIIYDSTNLKQTRENLRIYTIKVINVGKQHIIKEYYDVNDPVGIGLSSGKIIEQPQLIQSSNNYLRRNVRIVDYQADKVVFSQVILESGEHFTINILVLHRKDSIPTVLSFGKIAGQQRIDVSSAIDVKNEESLWIKVLSGDIWVQLLRLLTYFLAVVLVIAIIAFVSSKIDEYKTAKKRKRVAEEFKQTKAYHYTRMDDAIFARYLENGPWELGRMEKIIAIEETLNTEYKRLTEKLKTKEYRRFRRLDGSRESGLLTPEDFSLINEMISDGILFRENERLVVNQTMKDNLTKFNQFLKAKGELKNRSLHHERTILSVADSDDAKFADDGEGTDSTNS
jgi:hypothetical protein